MTVRLRALQATDASALARLANNKKIWNNVRDRMPHPFTIQDARAFLRNLSGRDNTLVRAIILPGQVFAGTVGLHLQKSPYEGSAELAYWLGEPFWGQGLASLAVQQLLAFGFSELQLRRVFARVYSFNQASVRVLEKNGFRCECVARAAVLKNNRVWDELTFGLLYQDTLPQGRGRVNCCTQINTVLGRCRSKSCICASC